MSAPMKNRSRRFPREKTERIRNYPKPTVSSHKNGEKESSELCRLQPWTPSGYTAFKALMSARLCAAIWSNISDCDETYNYWEPMHYLMHGHGFQTWEYSPVYAIRSYGYIWLHILPLRILTGFLQMNRILEFYFVRFLLGFCCGLSEVYFYSAGMFVSSTALLPSTFAMYLTMVAMAAWMLNHIPVAIFGIAAATIVGWPFAGALGIPIALDYVFRRREIWSFVKWSIVSALSCLVPLVQVDSHYYGGIVITPLNIVIYNVLSEHGPDLYGVESWTYYFINGFLNFNLAFVLALVSLPFALAMQWLLKQASRGPPIWLTLAPMYLWMIIFFTRPHKEERFLFPIYPLLCLAAAVSLDYMQKLYGLVFKAQHRIQHYTENSGWLAALTCLVFALISISRIMALFYGYHAPLEVYGELSQIAHDPKVHSLPLDKNINVCVGKEWYRFPSHFFMPDEKWRLHFIKSEFKGQLPKWYAAGPNATRQIPTDMNDRNLEEPTRYIPVNRCHYLVDVDVPLATEEEPRYSQKKQDWSAVASAKFLYALGSHPFFRAFYVPYFSNKHTTYVDYNILQSTRTQRHSKLP